ncbi:MAG TPA: hypothetical protein VL991_11850 [Terracidiphilus sp.]|nr:hypothetical protein [Terracidiphilus sp.]
MCNGIPVTEIPSGVIMIRLIMLSLLLGLMETTSNAGNDVEEVSAFGAEPLAAADVCAGRPTCTRTIVPASTSIGPKLNLLRLASASITV